MMSYHEFEGDGKDCRKGGIESSTVSGNPCDNCGAVPSKRGFLKEAQATLERVRELAGLVSNGSEKSLLKFGFYSKKWMQEIASLVEAQAKESERLKKEHAAMKDFLTGLQHLIKQQTEIFVTGSAHDLAVARYEAFTSLLSSLSK